jgi:hypothetical protein
MSLHSAWASQSPDKFLQRIVIGSFIRKRCVARRSMPTRLSRKQPNGAAHGLHPRYPQALERNHMENTRRVLVPEQAVSKINRALFRLPRRRVHPKRQAHDSRVRTERLVGSLGLRGFHFGGAGFAQLCLQFHARMVGRVGDAHENLPVPDFGIGELFAEMWQARGDQKRN